MRKISKIINSLVLTLIVLNGFAWLDYSSARKDAGLFELTMLNVGQGDSILIKTPENNYGLIDAGRGSKVLEELDDTLPFFRRELDFMILTHPDADHIEGAVEVLKRYKVNTVFIEKVNKDSEIYFEVLKIIKEKNITTYSIDSGNDFKFGEVNFDIIWPSQIEDVNSIEEPNDTSISFILSYKNLDIYFGGDLSSDFELASIDNAKIKDVEILKVSHHGSKTSSSKDFISIIKPEISLISVGENSYGHPTPEALKTLLDSHSQVLRTDHNGKIYVKSDGNSIEINTEDGQTLLINPEM